MLIYAFRGYIEFKTMLIYAFRGYIEFKTMLIYAFRGYFEFMGIFPIVILSNITSCIVK